MSSIKLVILDIDGVMTDGTKLYNSEGVCFAKRFNDKDFTAIKRIVAAGVPVVFLSGDKNINMKMAMNRNIPFFNALTSKGLDKTGYVEVLEKLYEIKREDMCYVGDDLFDIPIMKMVGFPCCPSDAISDVMAESHIVLGAKGGEGVVTRLFDYLLVHGMIAKPSLEAVIKIDNKEFKE